MGLYILSRDSLWMLYSLIYNAIGVYFYLKLGIKITLSLEEEPLGTGKCPT